MKTKRIVSFILAVLMLVSCMSLPTLAADATDSAKEATITVEGEYAVAGSTVTLDVSIQNNPGILGMTLEVEYDETAATLVAVKNGDCLSGMTFTTPKDLASGCRLPWDAENVAEEDIKDGVIVSLTFEIAEAAKAGSAIPVTLSYDPGAIIDKDTNPLSIKLENGAIRVIDYIPGDLNGDGIINTTDVVLLRRYIAGGYNVAINPSTGDVNADGFLNTTDVVLIRRFVAGGYNVILKPGKHTHTEVIDAAKAPTCTETGLTEGKHCSVCGEILIIQEVVVAKGHDFGEWVQTKAPTCTEKGAEKKSCKNCDHFETREIAMLNHEYVDNICKNCGQAEQGEASSEGLEFTLNFDGESYTVSGLGTCKDTDIVIPSTYEGKPVTSIGYATFSGCSSLTSIEIPDSVTSICSFGNRFLHRY